MTHNLKIEKMKQVSICTSNLNEYIQCRKNIESSLIYFIDNQNDIEENYQNMIQLFNDYKIAEKPDDLKEILYIIVSISNNFNRNFNFWKKIEQIILFFRKQIQEFWPNIERFHIFKENKRLLLFLINEKIVILDNQILDLFFNPKFISNNYIPYFYPEINEMLKNNLDIKDEVIKSIYYEKDAFLEKRQAGENDTLLCKIIQKDLINDFIIYINHEKIPLSAKIMTSIFETNSFLLENCPTLLEYSAFYGSVQIFRYLMKNGAKLTSSSLNYSIHGRNIEIIETIVKNQNYTFDSYINCLIESIKCHFYDLTQFIFESYLKNSIESFEAFDECFNKHCLKYFNYVTLRNEFNQNIVNNLIEYINKKRQKQNDYNYLNDETIEKENIFDEKCILYNFIENLLDIVTALQNKVIEQSEIIENITEENTDLKNRNKTLRLQNSILKKKE